jgi:hypothetical protein
MNKIDRDDLWRDALTDVAGQDFPAVSLERTLAATRRLRRARQAARIGLAVAVIAITALSVWHPAARSEPPVQLAAAGPARSRPEVRFLSDQDLFEMFPGRPMALYGPADDRQLVFLDEPSDPATEGAP